MATTAKPNAPATDATALEQTGPTFASVPVSGCPACGYAIRQLYAGEMICINCGDRQPQPAELRSRLVAVWPGRGNWAAVTEARRDGNT